MLSTINRILEWRFLKMLVGTPASELTAVGVPTYRLLRGTEQKFTSSLPALPNLGELSAGLRVKRLTSS